MRYHRDRCIVREWMRKTNVQWEARRKVFKGLRRLYWLFGRTCPLWMWQAHLQWKARREVQQELHRLSTGGGSSGGSGPLWLWQTHMEWTTWREVQQELLSFTSGGSSGCRASLRLWQAYVEWTGWREMLQELHSRSCCSWSSGKKFSPSCRGGSCTLRMRQADVEQSTRRKM